MLILLTKFLGGRGSHRQELWQEQLSAVAGPLGDLLRQYHARLKRQERLAQLQEEIARQRGIIERCEENIAFITRSATPSAGATTNSGPVTASKNGVSLTQSRRDRPTDGEEEEQALLADSPFTILDNSPEADLYAGLLDQEEATVGESVESHHPGPSHEEVLSEASAAPLPNVLENEAGGAWNSLPSSSYPQLPSQSPTPSPVSPVSVSFQATSSSTANSTSLPPDVVAPLAEEKGEEVEVTTGSRLPSPPVIAATATPALSAPKRPHNQWVAEDMPDLF
jgi:hypothetical protein